MSIELVNVHLAPENSNDEKLSYPPSYINNGFEGTSLVNGNSETNSANKVRFTFTQTARWYSSYKHGLHSYVLFYLQDK